MREIILVKNGELVLKGLNRTSFEDVLIKNMKRHLADLGPLHLLRRRAPLWLPPMMKTRIWTTLRTGLKRFSALLRFPVRRYAKKRWIALLQTTLEYLDDELSLAKTFKVEAKRSDKKFPLNSPEICREIGGIILKNHNHLKVDVHNPEITVTVEVRDNFAFVRGNNIKGAGGMPSGTSGRAAVLISGGIEQPRGSLYDGKKRH
jgi:thiamine biosynthesis protein ThiI